MAYFDADMDAEQEPVFDKMETEYTIYVNSLPSELNEVAIREVFSQYGRITGMLYPHKATWAYITYKSYREAERAIRELNDKKPLYLKVALAREKSVIKEEELQKSYVSEASGRPRAIDAVAEPPVPTRNDMKHQQGVGRGQALNAFHKHFASQMSDRCAENGSSPSSMIAQAPSVNEIEDPVNTNKLWTRGVMTVTGDGRRHVSLGRGYTLYEFPEQNPKIEEYITTVHERRHNGLYEYGEDKLKNGIQKCLVCSTKTTKHCERCNTYYCREACQRRDWPRHKVECERIPRLVEETVNDVSLLQINKDENQTKIPSMLNVTSKTIASNEVKLRRPNASNAMQADNSNSTNANANMHKSNGDMNCSTDKDTNNQDRHLSIRRDANTNVSYTKTADQPVLNAMNTKDFSKQNHLHRYNNTKEDTEKMRRNDGYSSTTSNFTNQNHNRHQNGAINKTSPNKERFDNNSSLRGRNYNSDRSQSYQMNELQNDRKSTACNNDKENSNRQGSNASNNNITMDDDLAFCKDMYLSKTEFTEIEISIPLSNNEYWAHKKQDSEARTNLMMELQDVARKSRNVQPIIGDIYAVLYETLWHRAMVISLNPVKVHFIDFGNDEILQKGAEIRDISDMTKIPNFARKIRLSPAASERYKNLKYGEKIFVRMLSMDAEKTIVVDVKEQSRNLSPHVENASNNNNAVRNAVEKIMQQETLKASNKSIKAPTIEVSSILDVFADLLKKFVEKGVSESDLGGFIQIHESAQENIYSGTFCQPNYTTEFEMLYTENNLQADCAKTQESAHYKPQVEDLICGEGKDGWCRGYILPSSTSSDLRITAIDEARILAVKKIVPCPEKYLNICAVGVICEVNHPNKLEVDIYQFTPIVDEQSRKQEHLTVKLTKDSKFICEAVVKSWRSINMMKTINMIKSSAPALSEIKSGSKICFTSYRNHYQMFARSLDEESIEYYNNIMQRVAQCARTAPHLHNPPNNMQSVIAPFSDHNSYRAMVVKTQDDKAQIVYTDFGNVDEVDIKELQVLPENLALQRSCSAKINLKDVPSDISMNTEVDSFLRQLLGNETPLTCVYEGDLLKDGVYLTMPTGESINDKINKLLIPTWKKDHDDNTCYMINDVEVASLGQEGDTVKALVLHVPEEGGMKYYMSRYDMALYTHINEVMPKLLTEYCENTEYYIPRSQELCLALYQNMWYRAVCINPRKSYTTAEVIYIDYGNMESVEHKDIRLMPKDFLTPAAMADMCTVVNLAPVDAAGNYSPVVQKKIAELIPKNIEMIVKIKIVEVVSRESGEYNIELVDIKNTLIEEGLVPPS